jgi:hypothetical protein
MDFDDDEDFDDPDVTEDALDAAFRQEREVMGLDFREQTLKLLEEAAPRAAQSIVNLAFNGANENTRLNAAKYVVDLTRDPESDAGKGILEKALEGLVKDAEQLANGKAV